MTGHLRILKKVSLKNTSWNLQRSFKNKRLINENKLIFKKMFILAAATGNRVEYTLIGENKNYSNSFTGHFNSLFAIT